MARPGIATSGDGIGPQVSVVGISTSREFSACSQVIVLPVYADMRPMIAVSVLSATFFSSLIGLPLRIAPIRSVCSWTYGSLLLPVEFARRACR